MDDFIAEVIENPLRDKVVDAASRTDVQLAVEELIGILHIYST